MCSQEVTLFQSIITKILLVHKYKKAKLIQRYLHLLVLGLIGGKCYQF